MTFNQGNLTEMIEEACKSSKPIVNTHKYVAKSGDDRAFYYAYRRRGGKALPQAFARHLQAFFDITFDSFVNECDKSHQDAMDDFIVYLNHNIGCFNTRPEANRYLQAVDSVHPYSAGQYYQPDSTPQETNVGMACVIAPTEIIAPVKSITPTEIVAPVKSITPTEIIAPVKSISPRDKVDIAIRQAHAESMVRKQCELKSKPELLRDPEKPENVSETLVLIGKHIAGSLMLFALIFLMSVLGVLAVHILAIPIVGAGILVFFGYKLCQESEHRK